MPPDETSPTGVRRKVVHTTGPACKVRLEASPAHIFTGGFSKAEHMILRFSMPVEPTEDNINPSMGLKWLRDGIDSANVFGMNNVNGQSSWNFFYQEMYNH